MKNIKETANISENTKPHFLGPRNEITHKKERIRDFFTVGTSRCKMVDEVIRCTYNEFRKCNFFLKNNFLLHEKIMKLHGIHVI